MVPHTAPQSDDPRPVVPDWNARPSCRATLTEGRTVRLEPFDGDRHATDLWTELGGAAGPEAANDRIRWFGWPRLSGPEGLTEILDGFATREGWSTSAIVVNGRTAGMASYMDEDAASGAVEIGAIAHGAGLARSASSTEAHYLLMRRAFDLGYRRYAWRCDDANRASKRAAVRLGFTHEGTWRQHAVKHGRNRDTAWFSILDREWPDRRAHLERWLDPSNFDAEGMQIMGLNAVLAAAGRTE